MRLLIGQMVQNSPCAAGRSDFSSWAVLFTGTRLAFGVTLLPIAGELSILIVYLHGRTSLIKGHQILQFAGQCAKDGNTPSVGF